MIDVISSIIESAGLIIVALIGFATVMYQVNKGRNENIRDHDAVMEKLVEVAEDLEFIEEEIKVIDAKLDGHLDTHKGKKKTTKKK